ncbi:FMN reductase [NAD(P)H] [Roseobacter fucihabitans]|uniref:FMN reductase [NAD(P)H] n=1 Tax=Roseobacter fucihabitans TaxID=1537242 RepID=A0ABZ2BRT7_9RHOB|nr:nitroreductase family protein [Roseobacter litoralis]MBC6964483.1 FMN reductase (NAD(P)H) [Roseobacter litoralis]
MSDVSLGALFAKRFGDVPHLPENLAQNETLRRLAARASCRHFTAEPVDEPLLQALCAAALCAPSKSDLQQRDILIVTDPELLAALKSLLSAQDWIADAPAMVVFLANNRRQRQIQQQHDQPFPNDHLDAFFNASLDAGIALAFFMVAAEGAGLGCCPISTIRNHLQEVAKLLHLPDHVFPVAAMGLGHPAPAVAINPRLSLAHTVHKNRFSDTPKQGIEAYDKRRLGDTSGIGWSAAKAKMYAVPQRMDFGTFIRSIGFKLD